MRTTYHQIFKLSQSLGLEKRIEFLKNLFRSVEIISIIIIHIFDYYYYSFIINKENVHYPRNGFFGALKVDSWHLIIIAIFHIFLCDLRISKLFDYFFLNQFFIIIIIFSFFIEQSRIMLEIQIKHLISFN